MLAVLHQEHDCTSGGVSVVVSPAMTVRGLVICVGRAVYKDVDYAMRLDDDSCFSENVTKDIFREMQQSKLVYAYSTSAHENYHCAIGLWRFVNIFPNTETATGFRTHHALGLSSRFSHGNVPYENRLLPKLDR